METIGKDSFHKQLMDGAYRKWTNDHWTYPTFIRRLDAVHRSAVLLGNLNYQVLSGGFRQWDHNGYSSCAAELLLVLDEMREMYPEGTAPMVRATVAEALTEIRRYRRMLAGLEKGEKQSWDSVQMLSCLSDRFTQLSKDFMAECETYLTRKNGFD